MSDLLRLLLRTDARDLVTLSLLRMRRGMTMLVPLVMSLASSAMALSNLTDHIMSMSGANDWSGIPGMTGRPNLPTDTELLVTVVADEAWIRSEGMTMESVEEALSSALASSGSATVRMTLVWHSTNMTMMSAYSDNSTGIGSMNDTDTGGYNILTIVIDVSA